MRPVRHFWVYFAAVLALAVFLRTYEITLRPLHSDEGVNYYFVEQTRQLGHYPYSHENYHGPSFFYLSRLAMGLFGDSELALRASAIFCGVLLMLVPLPLRKLLGERFVLISALAVTLSSSLVFYSRYAIHEMLLVLATDIFAFGIFSWLQTRSRSALYGGMLGLALMAATKETFVLGLATVGLGLLAAYGFRRLLAAVRAGAPDLAGAVTLALLLIALVFTGGFQWAGGLHEMLLAVPQWIGRSKSDVGFFQPFSYYSLMLLEAEPQTFAALLLPLVALIIWPGKLFSKLAAEETRFIRFLTVWGLSAGLSYSLISYKTPWLVINITLPMTLALAWWVDQSWEVQRRGRMLGVLLLATVGGSYAWRYNFEIPYGPNNPYSHYHTTAETLELVKQVEAYWQTHPSARMLIGLDGYWPLPYYLRGHAGQIAYLDKPEPEKYTAEYQLLLLNADVNWKNPDYRRQDYKVSEIRNAALFLKK